MTFIRRWVLQSMMGSKYHSSCHQVRVDNYFKAALQNHDLLYKHQMYMWQSHGEIEHYSVA